MGSILGLGVIQGLTEFLPISSSGHLIVLKAWFGVAAPGAALEAALHAGTLLAVFWAYRHWLASYLTRLWARDRSAWALMGRLALGSVPAGLVGLGLQDLVERYFTVEAVIVGWLATSVLLWVTPGPQEGARRLEQLGWGGALLVGGAQALALWPGLSRSGSTIAMARVVGLAPDDAAQFSFLLAIPAVLGASVLEVPSMLRSTLPMGTLAAAALLAAVTGAVAIQWVKGIVNRPRVWRGFGIYTAVVALSAWIIGG